MGPAVQTHEGQSNLTLQKKRTTQISHSNSQKVSQKICALNFQRQSRSWNSSWWSAHEKSQKGFCQLQSHCLGDRENSWNYTWRTTRNSRTKIQRIQTNRKLAISATFGSRVSKKNFWDEKLHKVIFGCNYWGNYESKIQSFGGQRPFVEDF